MGAFVKIITKFVYINKTCWHEANYDGSDIRLISTKIFKLAHNMRKDKRFSHKLSKETLSP